MFVETCFKLGKVTSTTVLMPFFESQTTLEMISTASVYSKLVGDDVSALNVQRKFIFAFYSSHGS